MPVQAPVIRRLGQAERKLVTTLRSEGRAALAAPRQLARSPCGLSSPATSRARLTDDPRFGTLADVPFRVVLDLVQAGGHGTFTSAA
jgi:ATP-dependent DNA helicase RecQ